MKTRLSLLTAVLLSCVHIYGQSPGKKPSIDLKTLTNQSKVRNLSNNQTTTPNKGAGIDEVPILKQQIKSTRY